MPAPRSQDVLVRAARLYYLEDRSQGEIAKTLGLSRSSVSRILSAAREQGVVEVRIHDPGLVGHVVDLEEGLVSAFGVKTAFVVPRPRGRSPIEVVARAAAHIFEERYPRITSFGFSWGAMIDRFAGFVDVEPINAALRICPLVGGLPSDAGPAGNTSLEVLAEKLRALSFRFESPSVVESPQTWSALMKESGIRAAIERAAAVDLAFVGIGSFGVHNSRRVVAAMHLSESEAALLSRQAPAGDICGRFYDVTGRPLGLPTSQRVIGISEEQLAAIAGVVGLAAGVEKALGVVGALRTGTLDEIVVDEDLARAVLNLAGAE
ncbi:sugar-binding transcriptional regulator [Propionicimonas sp.]|uniref:sugar-binding transcriptional regulator n=1 Tax=Propionicimonas sp. TaxID=1955623 RepID=UPI0039E3233B